MHVENLYEYEPYLFLMGREFWGNFKGAFKKNLQPWLKGLEKLHTITDNYEEVIQKAKEIKYNENSSQECFKWIRKQFCGIRRSK